MKHSKTRHPTTRSASSILLLLTIIMTLAISSPTLGQEIRNGFVLPARGTFRVLVLFAEVDFNQGPCGFNPGASGSWVGRVPDWAGELFDPEASPSPSAFLTDLYLQASFDDYHLLGDYYPKVFTIPCHEIRNGGTDHRPVLNRLAAEPGVNGTLQTDSGLPLSAFDLWSLGPPNRDPKMVGSNGRLDAVFILWRNRPDRKCNSGIGVHFNPTMIPIHDVDGIEALSSFNACDLRGAISITFKEHMHGIFGGNQWHTGGGAGAHSTLLLRFLASTGPLCQCM